MSFNSFRACVHYNNMRYKRRLFRICAVSLFFTIACIAQGNAAEKLAPHSNLVVGDCNLWHNSFFLGEIQELHRGLASLKYFCENAREYHVAVAGSLSLPNLPKRIKSLYMV